MAKSNEELEQAANARIADAVKILREDGILTNLKAIKNHLKIEDPEKVDPDAPPAPPKKEKPDPPEGSPPPKRRHWLYGDLGDDNE